MYIECGRTLFFIKGFRSRFGMITRLLFTNNSAYIKYDTIRHESRLTYVHQSR